VDAVHTKRAVAASFEELYRCVEDMCLHKMAPGLFQNLHALCDAHVAGAYTRPLFSST
jgi:cullin-4